MSNKEKEITRKLIEAIDALSEEDQKYMEGLADGIVLSKTDSELNKKDQPKKTG